MNSGTFLTQVLRHMSKRKVDSMTVGGKSGSAAYNAAEFNPPKRPRGKWALQVTTKGLVTIFS